MKKYIVLLMTIALSFYVRESVHAQPAAPTATAATNITSASFTANWTSVSGASAYLLDVSTNSSFTTFVTGYSGSGTTGTNKSVTGLTAGTVYYYRVRAVSSSNGTSTNSNVISTITLTPPVAPATLVASAWTANSFTATWSAVSGATNYRIDVSLNNAFSSYVSIYNNLVVSGTSTGITGLTANTLYYFRVRTVSPAGTSSNKNASTTTLTVPPVAVGATSITSSSFVANWNSVAGATNYRLDVSTVSDFSTLVVNYNNLLVSGTSTTVSNLNIKTAYYYRVRAENITGSSANSNVIFAVNLDHNYVRSIDVVVAGKTDLTMVENANINERITNYTFVDGLGRPIQNVMVQGSPLPLQKDIVVPVAYDDYSRESKKYLPYADETNGWFKENALKDPTTTATLDQDKYRTGKQYAFYQTGGQLTMDQFPYAETRFEQSPLSRVLKQGAAGQAWQPDAINSYSSLDKTIKKGYEFNIENEVLMFDDIEPNGTYPLGFLQMGKLAYYKPNDLYKNLSKDEQQNEIIEFTDKGGRTILKKVQAGTNTYAETYYIYDDFGNLVTVLQPEGLPVLTSNLPITWSSANNLGVSVSALNTLTKTAAAGYTTAGATSTETLAAGTNGWVEMTAIETNTSRMIGLSSSNMTGTGIQFAIELRSDGKIYVWENGTSVADLGAYFTGTVVRVARENNVINYYVDGVFKRTSAPTQSTGTLIVDAALDTNGATIRNVLISFKIDGKFAQVLNNYAFRYTYDVFRRMSQKQVPGADPVYMVYDKRDRLVLTQDGNQRSAATKYWTFTKYDELNRPILTGIKDTTVALTPIQMQAAVDAHYAKSWTRYYEAYIGNVAGNIHGYSNKSYPIVTDANSYLTASYYDNYLVLSTWVGSYAYLNESLSQTVGTITYTQPTSENTKVLGHPTASKIKVLDGGVAGGYTWLKNVTYYDDRYRGVQSISDNYKGGTDRVTNVYDFAGKILKTKTTHNENDVTWKDQSGVSLNGNKLISTTATATGAASVQQLAAGQNGWLEVVVSEINTDRYIGFNDTNPDVDFASIDYGFYMTGTTLKVIENNQIKQTLTNILQPGNILKIERIGSGVKYYRNAVEITLTIASTPSSSALLVDASLQTINATLVGVRTSFSNTSHIITRHFDYDHAGRLLKTWHQLDAQPEILLAYNQYNELGQLIDKKLHSTVTTASDARQSLDYRYNIRGWLTSMNNSQLANDGITNDDLGDFFGMNLLYEQNDSNLGSTGLFNGNISGMKWSSNLCLSDTKEAGYNYSYDAMNRLTAANSRMNKTNLWQAGYYDEIVSLYDLNGNIKNLQRKGDSGLQIDNLTYDYGMGTAASNKLLYVQDNTLNTTDKAKGFIDGNVGTTIDYTYDGNGNMTRDLNKGIGINTTDDNNKIVYNFLNLPEVITKSGTSATTTSSVRYIYDASGRKLSQVVTFMNAQKQTDYAGEFNYENDVLQFITHEEGRIMMASTKLIYTNTCDIVTADMTAVNATLASYTSNGEKYVKATSTATTAGTGIFPIGGTFNVQPGERYRIRAKGYRGASIAYLQVMAGATVLNAPGAELPNSTQTESWIEQIVTIPAGVTTLKAGIVWGATTVGEIIYLNEIEIDQLTTVTPEYQYNLKDHLGNTRITFTTKVDVDVATATLETANATTERSKFLRYDNARVVNHYLFDHTNGSAPSTTNGAAQRLSGKTNEIYGLGRSLSVMPGDVIDMEVYAKYIDSNSANRTANLNTLISQIAAGTAPAGTVVDGSSYTTSTSSFPYAPGQNGTGGSTGTGPKAYLNWLVFDRNYNLILSKSDYRRMTTAARETGQDVAHEKLSGSVTISEAGYIYIYLSNEEGASAYECYFDDFKVTHTKSAIIQIQDYYPFGLTFNNYQRENSIRQDYQYNAKEFQDELNLGWFDYGARMYEPSIAKWNGLDKMSDAYASYSPYNYVLGNPVANMDVNGEWTVTRHRAMTMKALTLAGIGGEQAKLIAHYTSVYADNPGSHGRLNNAAHPFDQIMYRDDVNYSRVANSQVTNYYGVGYNYNIWHSMRSPYEKIAYDAGGEGGISAEDAMLRGMRFGWNNVFRSAEKGKLGELEINSMGIEQFGQGLHALQDAYAHRGRHDVGPDHLKNDRFGDTSETQKITNSVVMVHSIMSGDTEKFNKMLSGGVNSLDLTGISGKNLIQLNDAIKSNGKRLKYNWNTKMYDVK